MVEFGKMTRIDVSNLRKKLKHVLNLVRYGKETVVILNYGEPYAVIVPLKDEESPPSKPAETA
jgi:prevent-host-death family protein